MTAIRRVRVAGHACLDLLPRLTAGLPGPGSLAQVGRLEMRPGGCVANTGLALAALGAPVELVAAVGDDRLGDAVAALLDSRPGVTTTLTRIAGLSTSYSIVIEPPGEDRSFLHHVGANEFFEGTDVAVSGTDLLHVGYPQLLPRLLDHEGAGLTDLLNRAHVAGLTTSVDFATVDRVQAGSHPWPAMVGEWAPLIDVLTPSVDDLQPVFPDLVGDAPGVARELAAQLVRAGVAVAVVTAGRAGMFLQTAGIYRLRAGGGVLATLSDDWANRQLSVPSVAVEPIRITGAGDTATAGFLFGLLAGFSPEQTLQIAASAAARHVSGTDPVPCAPPDAWPTKEVS